MDKDKQMSFLFEEGGIADDGMDRDPISGNEVPSGSLAEEVRDDIPAQLSEGEYVVPADVVRYYGVKFFEELRSEAKEGLGDMEEDGRIGGEPLEMEREISDDIVLSPEEEAELQSISGMAVGGYVEPAPQAVGNTGYMQGQVRQGYQEGGNVVSGTQLGFGDIPRTDAGTQVQYSPQMFPAGFATAPRVPTARFITLYSPTGEPFPIVLPGQEDKYYELLSEGYTEQPSAAPAIEQPEIVQPSGDTGGGGGGGGFVTPGGQPARDLTELTTEQLQANLRGLDTIGRIGSGLAVAINPVFGMAARGAINSSRANIVQELESRGEDMSDYREEHGRDLYGGGMSLYDGLTDVNQDGDIDFGDTWLGDALGFDGRAGVQGPNLRDSRGGSRRSFPTGGGGGVPAPSADTGGGNGGGGEGPSFTPSQGRTERQQETISTAQSVSREEDRSGGANLDTAFGMSGLKDGGFVSRRNKK